MDSLRQDLRLALRSLVARPLFSGVAILSITLGVGFTTAIFSGVNALLLRPVSGVSEPDRVVEIGRTTLEGRGFDSFTYPDFLDLRENATTLDEVAAWRQQAVSWASGDGGVRVNAMLVSPGYFRALGVSAARGRVLGPGEDRRTGEGVVVLGHRFWQDRLGGDPNVVGRTLELSRGPATVIGVMPPEFTGHVPALGGDVWMPISRAELADPTFDPDRYDNRRSTWLHLIGRLAPDATVEAADAEVGTLMAGLAEAYPESNGRRSARVIPHGPVPGGGRSAVTGFLGVLMALVVTVLLIAAANVAGMLLARSIAREREVAIRLAMGSGRGRLIRQLLMEALTLFVIGGAAGLALAAWGAGAFSGAIAVGPEVVMLDIRPDARVAAFSLAVSLAVGLVFGLVPALQASRPDLVPALKDDRRATPRGGRTRAAFAAAQIALSLVLLVAAGLFLRSLQRAGTVDTGFDPAGVTVVPLELALDGYDRTAGLQLHDRLLDRLRSMAGVDAAALALDLPMDLSTHGSGAWPEGVSDPESGGVPSEYNVATPGYFRAVGIPILEGRGFTAGDHPESEPVVVVSRTLAEAMWPGENPLGQRLRFGTLDGPLRTVVGVVADVKNSTLAETIDPMAYMPYAQYYSAGAYVVVRGSGPNATAVRTALLDVDPRLTLGPFSASRSYLGSASCPSGSPPR